MRSAWTIAPCLTVHEVSVCASGMDATPPRVTLIEIDELFRRYNHRIPLQQEDRVTILHGRNGVGKTVTLSLVAALLQGGYARLRKFPFTKLRIEFFSDGSYIEAHHYNQGIAIKFKIAGQAAELYKPEQSGSQVLYELRMQLPVHFIESQRLFKVDRYSIPLAGASPVVSMVQDIAHDMARRVKETDSEYRSTSTRLDNSLTARLFSATPDTAAIPEDLNQRAQALEMERRRLHEIGLIAEATTFNPSSLNETQRAMFAVVLQDNEEKMAVFKKLADRALILLDILNRKFAPKQLKLDKDTGYKVFTHDGQVLELDQLSSGEQHELVLLHTLLFRVERGALLLIDEPELSLHVTWQTEFLSDLILIAKTVGFDAVVATHSPYIVGSRRDLMVQLGEPV